jgi:hypothetical protein
MTVSETLEMKLSKREFSTGAAQVGSKLFGISLDGDAKITRLNNAVHWGHGTGMGVLRAPLSLAGLRDSAATAAHLTTLWSGDAVLYAALGIAPPPWRWKRQELITDLFHKGILALATGATYERIASRR